MPLPGQISNHSWHSPNPGFQASRAPNSIAPAFHHKFSDLFWELLAGVLSFLLPIIFGKILELVFWDYFLDILGDAQCLFPPSLNHSRLPLAMRVAVSETIRIFRTVLQSESSVQQ